MLLGVTSIIPKKTSYAINAQTPLISPSNIETVGEHIFVYDSSTHLLFKRLSTTPEETQPSPQILASVMVPNIIGMQAISSGDILILTENDGAKEFKLASFDLDSILPVTLSHSSYQVDMVANFAYYDGKVYALKNNGEIDIFTLSGTTLSLNAGTITKTNLSLINQESAPLKFIQVADNTLFLATNQKIFKVNISSLSVTKEYETTAEIICTDYNNGTLYALMSGGIMASKPNDSGIATINLGKELNFLHASSSGQIFVSSSGTHQIFSATGSTLKDLKFNETISPVLYGTTTLKFAKANEQSGLFLQPYSITPSFNLAINEDIVIIGEAPSPYNYYYVLYQDSTGNNHYLYLKKDANITINADPSSASVQIVTIRKSKIFTYPSVCTDATNKELITIPAGSELTANSSTILVGAGEELFYLVSYQGKVGYLLVSSAQPLKGAVEFSLKCDAKTKRATTIFENADGTNEIISLNKNTRISLQEELSPNKDYILIKYEAENGITYSGYIFADDIDPDGLSTLQILGISLVGVNILVLSLILIVKIRSKKWKRTSSFSNYD